MNKKREYVKYARKNCIRTKINALFNLLSDVTGNVNIRNIMNRGAYSGKVLLELQETYNIIGNLITSNKPFLVGRYGGSELKLIRSYFAKVYKDKINQYNDAIVQLCDLSGFFPKKIEAADKFVEYMLELSKEIDLLGIWYNEMEDYVCENYAINADFTLLYNLEPYYGEHIVPWTVSLRGRRVLVVHPFAETIVKQYNYRNQIWHDKNILPDFELYVVKAVQTLADERDDRFSTWFDALDYMVGQCNEIDFDVALVGCGAYGLPLAAEIKKMGKGAIHLGGALQVLFGIRGKRWDSDPLVSKFYNEYWVRPSEQEKPKGAERVENNCYW